MEKVVFVLLAGGSGRRFGGKTPKQFLKLDGKELICVSLEKLQKNLSWIDDIYVVLPKRYLTVKKRNILNYFPKTLTKKLRFVAGGQTRFRSLKNSLLSLAKLNPRLTAREARHFYVFVHDVARPRWDANMARGMLEQLRRNPRASGVVPVVAVRETIKRVNHHIRTLKNRETLFASQTPQLIRLGDFRKALKIAGEYRDYLDESQILEIARMRVLPFKGDALNVKITYPSDEGFLRGLSRG